MEEPMYLYKSSNHGFNLNSMRLNNIGCDVILKVKDEELCAHKIVLAANLKYFESMFFKSFQETEQRVITMKDIRRTDLEVFVSYAYTGQILLTESNALSLLEVANYLGEDGVKEACIEFLKKHLKTEEACRAYAFSNSIDCISLKMAAKTTILKNFESCSETTDYLNFDYESLIDILLEEAKAVKSQFIIFEGIIRWIKYDIKSRKEYISGLLSFIDVSKITVDDLIDYLYENVIDRNDEYGILKEVMFQYHINKVERKKQTQVLIVGEYRSKLQFQLYDFIDNRWSFPQEILDFDGAIYSDRAVVLNCKLYYIAASSSVYNLQEFNLKTQKSETLHFSSHILRYATLGACSRYLYLCGGENDNRTVSNQVIKYDPQKNSFEILPPMEIGRMISAVVFYQGYLVVLSGYNGSHMVDSCEKYDPIANKWTTFPSMCGPRRRFGVCILDEKLYVSGGYCTNNLKSNKVEVYDPSVQSWRLLANMTKLRSTFTMVPHEKKLLAIGGDDKSTVEIYDPSQDQWQIISHDLSSELLVEHPRGGLFPCDCVPDTS